MKEELLSPPFKKQLIKVEPKDEMIQNLSKFEATNIKKVPPLNTKPVFGPITPSKISKGSASKTRQPEPSSGGKSPVGSQAPSNSIELQLKIKCSKAFQKKEQKELSEIMKRIQDIVDMRKEFDAKQRSKLQDDVIDSLISKQGEKTKSQRKNS